MNSTSILKTLRIESNKGKCMYPNRMDKWWASTTECISKLIIQQ